MSRIIKTRIKQLSKTSAEWAKYSTFIPLKGEIVYFEPDSECSWLRTKVGDGVRSLEDLPFSSEAHWEDLAQEESGYFILDGGEIR